MAGFSRLVIRLDWRFPGRISTSETSEPDGFIEVGEQIPQAVVEFRVDRLEPSLRREGQLGQNGRIPHRLVLQRSADAAQSFLLFRRLDFRSFDRGEGMFDAGCVGRERIAKQPWRTSPMTWAAMSAFRARP